MHSVLLFYFIIVCDGRCDLSWAVKMIIDPLINSEIFLSLLFSFIYPPAVVLMLMCLCSPVYIPNKWENTHYHRIIDSPLHINPCESLPEHPVSWSTEKERLKCGSETERDRLERLGILSVMEAKFNSSWCHQSSRGFLLGRKIFLWKKVNSTESPQHSFSTAVCFHFSKAEKESEIRQRNKDKDIKSQEILFYPISATTSIT